MIFRGVTLVGMFLVVACWILFPDSPVLPADPCQQDIQKFCAGQKFRHGKIEDCLREHADEVSRECRGRVAAMRDQVQDSMQACAADVKKFCPNVPPGQGRVMRCLKEHESELSAACRAEAGGLRDLTRRKSPCYADQEKFCADVVPGEGRILDCLYAHRAELSSRCKPVVENAKGREAEIGSFSDACQGDLQKFCKGVPPGGSRQMRCLKEHESELSPTCRAESAELRDLMRRDSPCYADQEKFCGTVEPGEGRIRDCLYTHRSKLSPRCKQVVETDDKAEEQIEDFIDACRGDLQEFCKGVAPGGGRFVQCLRQHESEISDTCKAAIGPGRKQSQKSRRPPAETSQTQSQD